MAVTLYVWLPDAANVGHVSLEIGDVYVSFWPEGAAGKKDAKFKTTHEPSYMPNLHADIQAEGRKPDETLVLQDFDEAAAIDHWVGIQGARVPYQLRNHNCSHVVAACLESGTGTKATFKPSARAYGRIAGALGRGVWTPDQVLHYARELKSAHL